MKLGITKQLMNALDHQTTDFKDLEAVFPKMSEINKKAGVFVGYKSKS